MKRWYLGKEQKEGCLPRGDHERASGPQGNKRGKNRGGEPALEQESPLEFFPSISSQANSAAMCGGVREHDEAVGTVTLDGATRSMLVAQLTEDLQQTMSRTVQEAVKDGMREGAG